MRTTFTLFIGVAAVAAVVAAQTASVTPDALLQSGIASYRESHFAEAAKDLRAASDAIVTDEQMQTYVDTGHLPNIEKFETALVYLTLAETKLGNHERAREAVVRLETAERIESVYPRLQLQADAAEFPTIAARLVPGTKLNTEVAAAPSPAPAPSVSPATERADRQREIEEAVAKERARIQKEADQRIAAEREAAQRSAAQQIAASQNQSARTDDLVRLRQADAYADNGQFNRANEMYLAIANAPGEPRDIVAEAGVGLYRTSAFADALTVFRKLIPFARGEEDLRYYNAVALYETGDIASAKRELECALPFIVENEDVTRYRAKIETAVVR